MVNDTDDFEIPFAVVFRFSYREWNLRPSLLRTDFFRDYTLARLLADPEGAYYSLLFTRGVGETLRIRVTVALSALIRQKCPEVWTRVLWDTSSECSFNKGNEWRERGIQGFIKHWLPEIGAWPADNGPNPLNQILDGRQ
jgi:hypothetical protein